MDLPIPSFEISITPEIGNLCVFVTLAALETMPPDPNVRIIFLWQICEIQDGGSGQQKRIPMRTVDGAFPPEYFIGGKWEYHCAISYLVEGTVYVYDLFLNDKRWVPLEKYLKEAFITELPESRTRMKFKLFGTPVDNTGDHNEENARQVAGFISQLDPIE